MHSKKDPKRRGLNLDAIRGVWTSSNRDEVWTVERKGSVLRDGNPALEHEQLLENPPDLPPRIFRRDGWEIDFKRSTINRLIWVDQNAPFDVIWKRSRMALPVKPVEDPPERNGGDVTVIKGSDSDEEPLSKLSEPKRVKTHAAASVTGDQELQNHTLFRAFSAESPKAPSSGRPTPLSVTSTTETNGGKAVEHGNAQVQLHGVVKAELETAKAEVAEIPRVKAEVEESPRAKAEVAKVEIENAAKAVSSTNGCSACSSSSVASSDAPSSNAASSVVKLDEVELYAGNLTLEVVSRPSGSLAARPRYVVLTPSKLLWWKTESDYKSSVVHHGHIELQDIEAVNWLRDPVVGFHIKTRPFNSFSPATASPEQVAVCFLIHESVARVAWTTAKAWFANLCTALQARGSVAAVPKKPSPFSFVKLRGHVQNTEHNEYYGVVVSAGISLLEDLPGTVTVLLESGREVRTTAAHLELIDEDLFAKLHHRLRKTLVGARSQLQARSKPLLKRRLRTNN